MVMAERRHDAARLCKPIPATRFSGQPQSLALRIRQRVGREKAGQLNKRLTNDFFKMALPDAEPVLLIIDIVMQVVMRHHTNHLMP